MLKSLPSATYNRRDKKKEDSPGIRCMQIPGKPSLFYLMVLHDISRYLPGADPYIFSSGISPNLILIYSFMICTHFSRPTRSLLRTMS